MEKEKFEYTYSAPTRVEREEIEDIRRDYIEKTETQIKLDRLKMLDKRVRRFPKFCAWCLGVVAVLIFGMGLTMVLEWNLTVFGVAVGVFGVTGMVADYFIYQKIKQKIIKKYKPEILALSEELLNAEKL